MGHLFWFEIGLGIDVVIFLVALLIYTCWYFLTQVDKVRLHYQPTSFNTYLLEKCPTLHKIYYPSFLFANNHLNGGAGLVLRYKVPLKYERQHVNAKDGARLILNWVISDKGTNDSPVLLVLPGVTGGCDKPYVTHMINEAQKKGWHSVILVFPGCTVLGNEINTLTVPRFFSPVDLSDVEVAVDEITKRFPKSPIIGVGHSMGANMIVRYLGCAGGDTKIKACVSLSNPWDLYQVNKNLTTGVNYGIYNKHFAGFFKNSYKENLEVFKRLKVDHDKIHAATCIRDLDEHLTKHIYKFEDVDEYYRAGSCTENVSGVQIPLFVVQALDDPVVPESAIPISQLENNPNCFTCITKAGGHTGWLDGHFNPRGLGFADQLCLEFMEAFLENYNSKKHK